MAEEWLTYSELGERLCISPEAARQKAIRYHWPRRPANDGKTQVRVDVEDVKASAVPRKPREPSDARSFAFGTGVRRPCAVGRTGSPYHHAQRRRGESRR